MDCCKETKYNLLLKFSEEQKSNTNYLNEVSLKIKSIMGYTDEQANSAVQFASLRDHFVLSREIRDEVTKLSLKLANENIPHEVKLSKK